MSAKTHSAARVGDNAQTGEGVRQSVSGSSNVLINNRPALRVTDGIGGSGMSRGEVHRGRPAIMINNLNAASVGDPVVGPRGSIIEGSGNVLFGTWDGTRGPSQESWVALRLMDTTRTPLANQRFHMRLPDGSIVAGRLDINGEAVIAPVRRGSRHCLVSFPDVNPDHWYNA